MNIAPIPKRYEQRDLLGFICINSFIRSRPLSLLLVLTLLTGCDPIYGVSRRARVKIMPDIGSITDTIKTTPGVDAVEYRLSEPGRHTNHFQINIVPLDKVHTFSYHGGSNVHGNLQFYVKYDLFGHTVDFTQTLLRLGTPPPQEWVDATRPVMIEIEKRLEKTCGLTNLNASVTEWCSHVRCDCEKR